MTTYWFKPKRYGYGTTPVTWQGWAVTLSVASVLAASVLLMAGAGSLVIRAAIVVIDLVAVAVLVVVARRKTEGEWRWRWGDEQPNR
jgi:hypothetical protein